MKTKTMRLNEEEVAIIAQLRKLRAAEEAPYEVAAEVLEHGEVRVKRAAQLLGVPTKVLKQTPNGDEWAGLPPSWKGRVVLSEIAIALRRRHKNRLRELARAVTQLVERDRYSMLTINGHSPRWLRGSGVDEVARELGITKPRVERLLAAEDGLAWFRDGRRRLVTPEEVAAYKRKLERESGAGAALH